MISTSFLSGSGHLTSLSPRAFNVRLVDMWLALVWRVNDVYIFTDGGVQHFRLGEHYERLLASIGRIKH